VSQVELTKPTFEVDYVRVYSEAAPAPITVSGKIEAENYATMQGVDTENTNDLDGGKNVGWIDDNDWMEYDIDVAKSANYDFAFRSASLGAGGTLSLEVDGKLISNPVVLPITGGWQTWLTTVLKNVSLSKGIHKLKLKVINGGFNLNYIDVAESKDVTSINENTFNDLAIACPSIFHDQTQLKVNTIATVPLSIKAIDCRGIEVFSSDKYATNEQIQFGSTLPSGMYVLHFVYQNKVKIVKVVKM
jgi:hypothetical protein